MESLPKNNGKEEVPDPKVKELTEAFTKEMWEVWRKFQLESKLPPDVMYKQTALVLMHMSAVLAVDVRVNRDQFGGMAFKLWDDVYQKAPRFS